MTARVCKECGCPVLQGEALARLLRFGQDVALANGNSETWRATALERTIRHAIASAEGRCLACLRD